MGGIFLLLFLIPLTIFILIVVPIGMWMIYRRQQQSSKMLSESDARRLDELIVLSQKMRERIEVLESILEQDK